MTVIDFGTFTNRSYRNSDMPERHYQAAVFQGRYQPREQLDGPRRLDDPAEERRELRRRSTSQPARTEPYRRLPEAFTAERNFPIGRLQTFQRHRARLWTIYTSTCRRLGDAVGLRSLAVRIGPRLQPDGDERAAHRHPARAARRLPRRAVQPELCTSASAARRPSRAMGSSTSPSTTPSRCSARSSPWVKFDVFNLFNNDKLIGFDTTVIPDLDGPVDALGLPTGFIRGQNFGEARGAGDFPRSLGATGGRTFRMSVGLRF